MYRRSVYFALVMALAVCAPAQAGNGGFHAECPTQGRGEVVSDPAAWADACFQAINGRMPIRAAHEAFVLQRDIDLDGHKEWIEARGTGQAAKSMYVFRQARSGTQHDSDARVSYRYLGMFNANPAFHVMRQPTTGLPLIVYTHRYGVQSAQRVEIVYTGQRFRRLDKSRQP